MKSKKKKDDPGTPAKTALSSEYDAESGLAANPDKESSAGGLSRSSSKKSSKLKKSKNATGAPSRRRFSIRNWIFNNPIFPPPFGNSGGRTTVTERYTPTATSTAGPSGSSRNTSRKSENSVPDSSWRDNVSSYSQGQAEVRFDLTKFLPDVKTIFLLYRERYLNVRYVWVTIPLTNSPCYAIVPTSFAWNVCILTPNWRFKKEELTLNARSVQNLFILTVSIFTGHKIRYIISSGQCQCGCELSD